jgi:proteasome lid subunit RPN8/RPN11
MDCHANRRNALSFPLESALNVPNLPANPPDRLIISPSIRQTILLHLLESAPNEGVGLLSSTTRDDGRTIEAIRFYPGGNVAASPSRFAMDPRDVLHAIRDIRRAGHDLGGIVHSHLFGPPTPSEIDLDEAHYPDSLMIIVSFARQPAEMRAWHIRQNGDQKVVTDIPIESEFPEPIIGKQR